MPQVCLGDPKGLAGSVSDLRGVFLNMGLEALNLLDTDI